MNIRNISSYKLKDIPIQDIDIWEEAQARILDTNGIAELAKSIESEGLQNPPLVRKDKSGKYMLIAGQRRLAAMKSIGVKATPALVLDDDTAGQELLDAKAISIIENLHRKDMSAAQMATSCRFLVEKIGKIETAHALGIKQKTLREYLGFAAVPQQVKELVPTHISKRDAVRIYKKVASVPRALDIAKKISKYDVAKKKRYLDALDKAGPSADHSEVVKIANRFRARQNIAVKLSKNQANGLSKMSREQEIEPNQMAHKIISEYLSRRGIKT